VGKTWSFTLPPWETIAGLIRSSLWGYRDKPIEWLAPVGGLLLVGIWLAGSLYSRGRTRSLLFMAVAVPQIIYAGVGWVKPIYHPKYMLPWLVFAALAVGGLVARRPRLGSISLIATSALMLLPTWRTIQLPYYYPSPAVRLSRNDWLRPIHRQMAEHLERYAAPTDAFGLGVPSLIDCYYASVFIPQPAGCNLLLEYSTESGDEVRQNLSDLLNQHPVLWYREERNLGWDTNSVVEQVLNQRAVKLGTEATGDIPLQLYAGPATILRQQQSIGAGFGGVAELTGIWLAPRGDLHLVLVWRSLADHPPLAAKVFVHLVNARGEILAQVDNVPVSWTRPLETWQRDEQLLDAYSLPFPADQRVPGTLLQIGLYDPDTNVRLPAYDQRGALLPDNTFSMSVPIERPNPGTP
jgi:hypothetical protein